MGVHVTLRASDGHELDAYVARPPQAPVAGLVVIQEAFGVNSHIRAVADGFARDGFLVVAPALFDRIQRGVELGYTPEELQKGIALARQGRPDDWVKDVEPAIQYARSESGNKKVGVIGYCLGGTVAWISATRLHPDAAVGYYGGSITNFAAEKPNAPVMLHFGLHDQHIPRELVEATIRAGHPKIPIFWYEAGHGFDTSDRSSYNAEASQLARRRSLEFLRQHLTA